MIAANCTVVNAEFGEAAGNQFAVCDWLTTTVVATTSTQSVVEVPLRDTTAGPGGAF